MLRFANAVMYSFLESRQLGKLVSCVNAVNSAGSEADFLGIVGREVCVDLGKPVLDAGRRGKAAGSHKAREKSRVGQCLTAASTANASVSFAVCVEHLHRV